MTNKNEQQDDKVLRKLRYNEYLHSVAAAAVGLTPSHDEVDGKKVFRDITWHANAVGRSRQWVYLCKKEPWAREMEDALWNTMYSIRSEELMMAIRKGLHNGNPAVIKLGLQLKGLLTEKKEITIAKTADEMLTEHQLKAIIKDDEPESI